MIDEKQLSKALAKRGVAFRNFSRLIEFGSTDERIKIVLNELVPKAYAKENGKVGRHANMAEIAQSWYVKRIRFILQFSLAEVIDDRDDALENAIYTWLFCNLFKVANACREGCKLKKLYKPFYKDFVRTLADGYFIHLRRTETEKGGAK